MLRKATAVIISVLIILSVIPQVSFGAESNAVISIEKSFAKAGQSIEVKVKITDNPGLLGAILTFDYDPQLILTAAENGEAFSALKMTKPGRFTSPCSFVWDGQDEIANADGTILKLVFTVVEDTAANEFLRIGASYAKNEIVDENLEPVNPTMVSGGITVIDYIPGDATGDAKVNTVDVSMIRRFKAGGYDDDPINEAAADVNDDGGITTADITLIRRFIAGGYDVVLKPSSPKCSHEMTAVPEEAASCETDGHIAYWCCSICDKCFADEEGTTEIELGDTVIKATGHTVAVDEAVAPTYTSTGLTEGKHCSVCGSVLVKQETIPVLQKDEYSISYYIDNNDEYLKSIKIENPNPNSYSMQEGLTLQDLIVDGYNFVGWYTAQTGGTKVTKIAEGETGNKALYAHWEKVEYTISFASDMVPVEEIVYTVGEEKTLKKPTMDKYTFVGWSDKNGKIWDSIPAGTTGNMVLYANWASNRNRAVAVNKLEDPLIFEDSDKGLMLFTYEIGEIRNVPLFTTLKLQCANGIITTIEKTNTNEISSTSAETIAQAVSNATTNSASWTLSSDWNKTTEVSQLYIDQSGYTREEAETMAKSNGSTYSIGSSSGGSNYIESSSNEAYSRSDNKSHSDTNTDEKENSVALTIDNKLGFKVGGSVSADLGKVTGSVTGEISGEMGKEDSEKNSETTINTGTDGWANTIDFSTTKSNISADTKNWNSSSGFTNSNSVSTSNTVSETMSRFITDQYGYGESYSEGGSNSKSQALAATASKSDEYSAALTYYTSEIQSATESFSSTGNTKGGYRMVMAGTVHVFAVVGYNVSDSSYFVYTYNVLDDETEEYLDYSFDETFNDYETSIIPFEVPYFVNEYVNNRIAKTEGLVFEPDTGMIVGYEPVSDEADQIIVIPSYMSVDNNDGTFTAVKVKGIVPELFKNNTDIVAVQIGNYIEEIPDSTFEGCSSLEYVLSPSVTKIGDKAFSGCTSLKTFSLSESVKELGTNSFEAVPEIKVIASTADIAQKTASSGADRITLDISAIPESESCNLTLEAGNIELFELQGKDKEYKGLRIKSDAETTVINGVTLTGNTSGPIELSSKNVTLDRVTANCAGYALILKADETNVLLNRNVNIESASGKTVLSRSVNFARLNSGISAKLNITGDMLVCGNVAGSSYLTFTNGEIIYITEEEYNNYLNCRSIFFDANGGSTDIASKPISLNTAVGELPVPERDGYTFAGWYTLSKGGSEITEDTVVDSLENIVAYAHWEPNVYKVSWDDVAGYTVEVKRTDSPNMGAELGLLTNGSDIYYGDVLSVEYSVNNGFDMGETGETEITVADDVTSDSIYAIAEAKRFTASWQGGTGYTITVTRTASPYKNAAIGTLTSGAAIYYGDVLSVKYSAATNYKLTSTGAKNITVTGNVDKTLIYASASLNEIYVTTVTGYDSQYSRIRMNIDIYVVGQKVHLKGWIYDTEHPNDAVHVFVNFASVMDANLSSPDCPVGGNHGIDWIADQEFGEYDRIMLNTNLVQNGDPVGLWDHWVYTKTGQIGA